MGVNDALPERLWTPSWQFRYSGSWFYDPFPLIYWDIENVWAPKTSQLMKTRAIDWVFIIGGLLSLMALLFTFDAFIGEKERGTLRLVMAQSLPRHTLLLGKFLGAMLGPRHRAELGHHRQSTHRPRAVEDELGSRRGRALSRHGRLSPFVSGLLCRVGAVGVDTEQHHALESGRCAVAVDLRKSCSGRGPVAH